MSIGINSKYLQKALESNRELADFYVDTKIDVFKLCATFRGKYKIGGEHE